MKKVLFIAVMMLAALGATAGEDPNDHTCSMVVPEGTPANTVVWAPELDDELTYGLNLIKNELSFTVDGEYSANAKNVFNFDTDTGVITVKENASFKYGDSFGFRFIFTGEDGFGNQVVAVWTRLTLVIGKAAFAEDTEDKDNWTIEAKGMVTHAGIQATYSGKRKVKSVTAKRKEN